jgi:hypothetical protein
MFFKDYFISVANTLQSKHDGYTRKGQNNADLGELRETFLKDFLQDSLGDSFKIFRGGKIVDIKNNESKQIDIVLCGKNTIKIFSDKGIYPTETVFGVFCITSNLTKKKLVEDINVLQSIPKKFFSINIESFAGSNYAHAFEKYIWDYIFPYKCVFAFSGNLKEEWIKDLNDITNSNPEKFPLMPDLIVVNKVGMIQKKFITDDNKNLKRVQYTYTNFNKIQNTGICFSSILYNLYNISKEESLLNPNYARYFIQDL